MQQRVIRISRSKFYGVCAIVALPLLVVVSFAVPGGLRFFNSWIIPVWFLGSVGALIFGALRYVVTSDELKKRKGTNLMVWGILIGILSVVVWGVVNVQSSGLGFKSSELRDIPFGPSPQSSSRMPAPPFREQASDITDTREFLKINFSATLFTRKVSEVSKRVEDAVRLVDGRIDSLEVNERSAFIRFVIPKSDLSEFRDQLETLVHAKLYVENISSQNLLTEKQNIEGRTDMAEMSLAELEADKKSLDASHRGKAADYQAQLVKWQNQLDGVRSAKGGLNMAAEGATSTRTQLESEEETLIARIRQIQNEQASELQSYTTQNKTLTTRIEGAGGVVTELAEEDEDFMNDVETVNGYVQVRWISLWGMGERFSPTPMVLNAFVAFLLFFWLLQRVKILPKIELV